MGLLLLIGEETVGKFAIPNPKERFMVENY